MDSQLHPEPQNVHVLRPSTLQVHLALASVKMDKLLNGGISWDSTGLMMKNGHVMVFYIMEIYITHRIHGAAIYGNIYHQYTPNVSIYIPYMDPTGNEIPSPTWLENPLFTSMIVSARNLAGWGRFSDLASINASATIGRNFHGDINGTITKW